MNDNTYNFSKRAKLYLCCSRDDLRPAMNNIYFDDGHAIATNGHIMICADLHDISNLNDEDIEKLNGKLLNGASYKELLKYPRICITDNAVEAEKPIGIYGTMKASFEFTKDTTYPNYRSVLDDIWVLILSASKKIADSVGVDLVYLKFFSKSGAVEVFFEDSDITDTRGLVMPLIP